MDERVNLETTKKNDFHINYPQPQLENYFVLNPPSPENFQIKISKPKKNNVALQKYWEKILIAEIFLR